MTFYNFECEVKIREVNNIHFNDLTFIINDHIFKPMFLTS